MRALSDPFELEEIHARRWLRVPGWIRFAVAARGPAHLGIFHRRQHKRLAFRRPYGINGRNVVLRQIETGVVVRMPFD